MTEEEIAFIEKVCRRAASNAGQNPDDYVYMAEPERLLLGAIGGYIINPKNIKRLWVLYVPVADALFEEMARKITL